MCSEYGDNDIDKSFEEAQLVDGYQDGGLALFFMITQF